MDGGDKSGDMFCNIRRTRVFFRPDMTMENDQPGLGTEENAVNTTSPTIEVADRATRRRRSFGLQLRSWRLCVHKETGTLHMPNFLARYS